MIRKGMNIELTNDNSRIISLNLKGNLKLDRAGMKKLSEIIDKYDIKTIIIDPFATAHGREENSAISMGTFMRENLKSMADTKNLSFILIHHCNKGEYSDVLDSLRGSSEIANTPESVIFLNRENKRDKKVKVSHEKSTIGNEEEDFEVKFEFSESANEWVKISLFDVKDHIMEKNTKQNTITIALWSLIDNINEFTTSEAKIYLTDSKVEWTDFNLNEALNTMENHLKIIKKTSRGRWEVIKKE